MLPTQPYVVFQYGKMGGVLFLTKLENGQTSLPSLRQLRNYV